MKYVYILQSVAETERFYTGITDDLHARLSKHNSGSVTHTANSASVLSPRVQISH